MVGRKMMGRNPKRLSVKLNNFISQINLQFSYNNCITVDLMDYFPLLKHGYCNFITLLTIKDICDIFYSQSFLINIFGNSHLDYLSDISSIDNVTKQLSNDMNIEEQHAIELYDCLEFMRKYTTISLKEPNNLLCQLLTSFESNSIYGVLHQKDVHSSLYDKLLLNNTIKLIHSILNCDENKMNLYLEYIDPRIGNNEIYKLSIDNKIETMGLMDHLMIQKQHAIIIKENNGIDHLIIGSERNKIISDMYESKLLISNMIRDITIKRNWIEQQVLIDNFETLIGSSDIPNNIFNYINNLR